MLRNWRFWLLIALQLAPPGLLILLGFWWLAERGWWWWFGVAAGWALLGGIAGILMSRWTSSRSPILPPIDWDEPTTFTPRDRQAWALVQAEAERVEGLPVEALTGGDTYIDSGRRLAEVISRHYHPDRSRPLENVAVVDVLAALELAAEDLGKLCREIPGGDMITPSHWRKAVQAAGYLNRANEIYGYLLPFIQPATGLVRLGAQKLMVQPAWKNMQQNLQRWFFRAYVNRLGTHLIELYSGRLAIGADQYRKLTGRSPGRHLGQGEEGPARLVIGVTGAKDSGKSRLIEVLDRARLENLDVVRRHLAEDGFDDQLAGLLASAAFEELEDYPIRAAGGDPKDRSRRKAVEAATECDLMILAVDGRRSDFVPEGRFAGEWIEWFQQHPTREAPPALAVLVVADTPEQPGGQHCDGPEAQPRVATTRSARKSMISARVESLRKVLPEGFRDVVPLDLVDAGADRPTERLLPEMAACLHRAERVAVVRYFQREAGRSKFGRFLGQVGRQSRRIWSTLRERTPARADRKPS